RLPDLRRARAGRRRNDDPARKRAIPLLVLLLQCGWHRGRDGARQGGWGPGRPWAHAGAGRCMDRPVHRPPGRLLLHGFCDEIARETASGCFRGRLVSAAVKPRFMEPWVETSVGGHTLVCGHHQAERQRMRKIRFMVVGPPPFLMPAVRHAWGQVGIDLQGPYNTVEFASRVIEADADGAI